MKRELIRSFWGKQMTTTHRSKVRSIFTLSSTFVFTWVKQSSLKVNACVPNVANSAINHSKNGSPSCQCQCSHKGCQSSVLYFFPGPVYVWLLWDFSSIFSFLFSRSGWASVTDIISTGLRLHNPTKVSCSLIFVEIAALHVRPLPSQETRQTHLQLLSTFLRHDSNLLQHVYWAASNRSREDPWECKQWRISSLRPLTSPS